MSIASQIMICKSTSTLNCKRRKKKLKVSWIGIENAKNCEGNIKMTFVSALKSTLQFTEGHLSQVKMQLSSALDAVDVYMDVEGKWCEREAELMDTIQKLASVDTKDVEVQVESSHAERAVQTEEGDQSGDVDESRDGEGVAEKEVTDGTLKVEENVDSPTIQPDDERAKE